MLKSEFESRVNQTISEADYQLIERVYMYYPGINDKDQIAELYKRFGMRIIEDMLDRSNKVKDLEDSIRRSEKSIAELKIRLSEL